jgi:hypothetical protein
MPEDLWGKGQERGFHGLEDCWMSYGPCVLSTGHCALGRDKEGERGGKYSQAHN